MRSLVVLALLTVAPNPLAAQANEPTLDLDAALELDLTELPGPALEALRSSVDEEVETRLAELPAFEVAPVVLIGLAVPPLIAGFVTFSAGFEGPFAYLEATMGLWTAAGVLLVTGLAWMIERVVARRLSPSAQPLRRARRVQARVRRELRRRRPRTRSWDGTGRHPRRSPWH
ncbi:MAG: hypothetical protein H6719_17270 [Sandaracinaceae bacterium]|nr:hypothetical protein [Sandaracinaceae bacterium]